MPAVKESSGSRRNFCSKRFIGNIDQMVEAEQQALKKGKSRKEAIYAAYEPFL